MKGWVGNAAPGTRFLQPPLGLPGWVQGVLGWWVGVLLFNGTGGTLPQHLSLPVCQGGGHLLLVWGRWSM